MSIEFNCAKCRKGFTVSQASAGKKGTCKECGHVNTIPTRSQSEQISDSASRTTSAKQPAAMFEVTSSVNGSVFGPADRALLTQWNREGRITPHCQIKQVGTDRWTIASTFFPDLADTPSNVAAANDQPSLENLKVGGSSDVGGDDRFAKFKSTANPATPAERALDSPTTASTSVNPYRAGSIANRVVTVGEEVVPTSCDLGFILSHALDRYKKNFGSILGAALICLAVVFAAAIFVDSVKGTVGQAGEVVLRILNFVISTYFFAGTMQVMLKAGRSQPTKVEDMFGVTDRVLPLVGYSILAYLVILVPIAIIGGIGFAVLNVMGGQLPGQAGTWLAIPLGLILFTLIIVFSVSVWPGYFLVMDRQSGFASALPLSLSIAKKNFFQIIALMLISGLIAWAGFLLLCVGFIFTAPLAMMIVACGYLNMTGQISQ